MWSLTGDSPTLLLTGSCWGHGHSHILKGLPTPMKGLTLSKRDRTQGELGPDGEGRLSVVKGSTLSAGCALVSTHGP